MNKPEAIIIDLDGTLAELNGRNPYDASTCEADGVNQLLLDTIRDLFMARWKVQIIFVTGRQLKDQEPTKKWIEKFGFTDYKLYMRPNGYKESANELKRLIYENTIRDKYSVILALEDSWRNAEMFRAHGVPCWQVNRDPMFEKKEKKA